MSVVTMFLTTGQLQSKTGKGAKDNEEVGQQLLRGRAENELLHGYWWGKTSSSSA